tara:strand:+ start:1701 stop:2468 length:768 start_codon:yes stop_codon:yes gene_type:complete
MSSKKSKTLILSSYFSKKPHPNDPSDTDVIGRGVDGHVPSSSFGYIKNWYESIISKNLNGVIFHDSLTDDFIDKYSNDNVTFIKVGDSQYSNNDFRFYCFFDYLNSLNLEPDCVFHADVSDVVVTKDPAPLIHDNPSVDYFTCKDSIKLKDFPYVDLHEKVNWDEMLLFLLNQNDWDLINMGVIGGSYENMLTFYKTFVSIRDDLKNPEFNADMWICQYILRSQLQPCELMIGDPVCSEFKKYQTKRKDVYFIHK